jgi:ABC-type multidrug transport system permease subunit
MACPDGYNAADHWMDLLVQDSAIDESSVFITTDTDEENNKEKESIDEEATRLRRERTRGGSMTTRQLLIGAWDNEAVAEQMDACVQKDNESSLADPLNDKKYSKYNTGWMVQYRTLVVSTKCLLPVTFFVCLCLGRPHLTHPSLCFCMFAPPTNSQHRSLKNSRSAIFTPINIIKSCALGLVSGLLWFQMAYTESTVFDRSSFFFFTMTFWVFDAMFQSFMAFPQERVVILKERASGSYRLSAYFMAKTTSEMPTRLVLPLIYMIISFWMAAISNSFGTFVATTLISLLSVMAGEAIGLFVGATIYDMEKGMTAMTVISLALALLGGFFVQNVPSFLLWAKFLSPFKYAFDASLPLVFGEPVPCDGSGALEDLCGGSTTGYASSEDVIEFLGVQGTVGFNIAILIVIGLVPRYVAYLALRAKKEGER